MSSAPLPASSNRRLKLVGVLVMALGVLCAGLAVAPVVHAFSVSFFDELTSPVYTAPFAAPVSLTRGKYQLLESESSSAQVMPDAVQVIDSAANTTVGVRQSSGNITVSRSGERFVDVVEFTASHSGRYQIDVAQPPDARLIVGRDPGDAFGRAARWLELGGGGLLLLLLGFVLLLIGFSHGGPSRRRPVWVHYGQPPGWGQQPALGQHSGYGAQHPSGSAPPNTAPPPGWYPDPGPSGGWRYWDGYRWQP